MPEVYTWRGKPIEGMTHQEALEALREICEMEVEKRKVLARRLKGLMDPGMEYANPLIGPGGVI